MERLIAWYRVGSSAGAVVALVAANLVPLIGVLWFGWSMWTILTIIFGAFAVILLGAQVLPLVILVALKTAVDLASHLREHRAAEGPAPVPGRATPG